MSLSLECRKMKRTGFAPALFCGGALSAAVPILNMAVRRETYLGLAVPPVQILMKANWQMMAMLNVLLITVGACLLYHAEYADGAMQRMRALPLKESGLFFGKAALLALMCFAVLGMEAAGISFCSYYWFSLSKAVWAEIMKSFGYALLLSLPAVLAALVIASACENLWISLGICVVCLFTATMLPTGSFGLSLFPFALPFQMLAGVAESTARGFIIAALSETLLFGGAEILILKRRRLSA